MKSKRAGVKGGVRGLLIAAWGAAAASAMSLSGVARAGDEHVLWYSKPVTQPVPPALAPSASEPVSPARC